MKEGDQTRCACGDHIVLLCGPVALFVDLLRGSIRGVYFLELCRCYDDDVVILFVVKILPDDAAVRHDIVHQQFSWGGDDETVEEYPMVVLLGCGRRR